VCASPTELTARDATSITDRTWECWLATYTVRLSGATTTPCGSVPTLIEARTAGRSALTITGGVAAVDGLGDASGAGEDRTGGSPTVVPGWLRSTAPSATPPPAARMISTTAAARTRRQRRPPAGGGVAAAGEAAPSGDRSFGSAAGSSGPGATVAEPV
jgi:hypothetical protein